MKEQSIKRIIQSLAAILGCMVFAYALLYGAFALGAMELDPTQWVSENRYCTYDDCEEKVSYFHYAGMWSIFSFIVGCILSSIMVFNIWEE